MGSPRCLLRSFAILLISCWLPAVCAGQASNSGQSQQQSPPDTLPQHYDAARTYQVAGDQEHATAEYRAFLAEALRRIANARASAGNFAAAAQFFQEALAQQPENSDVRLDFASARFQEGNLPEARSLAEKVVQADPKNAKARYLLGNILFEQGDYKAAKEQLEPAVVAAPTFENGYLLGVTYLKLNDLDRAALVFNEMVSGLGDTPQIHIYLGRAYREGERFDEAIAELKKAIAMNPNTRQAHYFMGLAYVSRDGDSGFPEAIPQFKAEIKLSPDDYRSHYMLGYIAWKQHNAEEAEKELVRASSLDPQNPDPLVYLGQLYHEANRLPEAEATLRKAIALTKDVSRNEYAVNRAHYVLGRLLLQAGRKEEGQQELKISEEIRRQIPNPANAKQEQSQAAASLEQQDKPGRANSAPAKVSPAVQKQVEAYIDDLKPQLADTYNNLGVAAAGGKDFAAALDYFRKAAVWNPSLETLDRNLGMAAFYADQFDQAVAPLERHLQAQTDDLRARAALGLSFYALANYPKALETLRPIQSEVDADPGLSYAYAVSLIKVGDYNTGVARLQAVEKANPNSAEVHTLLGSAFADQGVYATAIEEYRKSLALAPKDAQTHFLTGLALIHQGKPAEAVPELRTALKLNPAGVDAKYHLAFALLQTQQKAEASTLLREVIGQNPKHADAYYQLGKMQLEDGQAKAAIANLETGAKLSPDSDYIHYQLALAYRRDSRTEDAQREMKLYQELKNRRRGGDGASSK